MNSFGQLYVISAPSGAGKTSLVRALVEKVQHLKISVSHTTRPKRSGEEEGSHYFFVDEARFEKMLSEQLFLEHANVFGYHYGTFKAWVEAQLSQGEDILLEIDWQGSQQVTQLFPNCVRIFILPPSREELARRLRTRAQDNDKIIEERLAMAKMEVSHYHEFDYVVVNDDFMVALADLEALVRTHRLRASMQQGMAVLNGWL